MGYGAVGTAAVGIDAYAGGHGYSVVSTEGSRHSEGKLTFQPL